MHNKNLSEIVQASKVVDDFVVVTETDFVPDKVSVEKIKFVNLKNLPSKSFVNNTALKHVEAPVLSVIGKYAFSGCSGLEVLNAPNLSMVDEGGLHGAKSLKTNSFPNLQFAGTSSFTGTGFKKIYAHADCYAARGAFDNETCITFKDFQNRPDFAYLFSTGMQANNRCLEFVNSDGTILTVKFTPEDVARTGEEMEILLKQKIMAQTTLDPLSHVFVEGNQIRQEITVS